MVVFSGDTVDLGEGTWGELDNRDGNSVDGAVGAVCRRYDEGILDLELLGDTSFVHLKR